MNKNCTEIGNGLKSRICFEASCARESQPAPESKHLVVVLIKSYRKSLMKAEQFWRQLWVLHAESTSTQIGIKTAFSGG